VRRTCCKSPRSAPSRGSHPASSPHSPPPPAGNNSAIPTPNDISPPTQTKAARSKRTHKSPASPYPRTRQYQAAPSPAAASHNIGCHPTSPATPHRSSVFFRSCVYLTRNFRARTVRTVGARHAVPASNTGHSLPCSLIAHVLSPRSLQTHPSAILMK
jgi:hypothetical protein